MHGFQTDKRWTNLAEDDIFEELLQCIDLVEDLRLDLKHVYLYYISKNSALRPPFMRSSYIRLDMVEIEIRRKLIVTSVITKRIYRIKCVSGSSDADSVLHTRYLLTKL